MVSTKTRLLKHDFPVHGLFDGGIMFAGLVPSKSLALALRGCNAKCHSRGMPMQLLEQVQDELP